uniref:Fe2OG dioxygenase domain-containing protein n=1 Tax=Strigamia maritima TaxID=126957 RepID=T1J2F7_STRMM
MIILNRPIIARVRIVFGINMSAAINVGFELNQFQVTELPATVYYIPDFIDREEEQFLLDHVYRAPKPKWTQLSRRRLQNWGGLPHPKGMAQEIIPKWLEIYMEKINQLGIFNDKRPNHVLVNEYLSGQGIMPHTDGPLFTPVITTINLESHGILDFYHQVETNEDEALVLTERYFKSILLMPRSLLIVQDDMYHKYLHGIREITEDEIGENIITHKNQQIKLGTNLKRGKRVSLTIRNVPKTLNLHLKMGKLFKKVN